MTGTETIIIVPEGDPAAGVPARTGIPPGASAGGMPCAEITAMFGDLPVRIRLFQFGGVFGVGVYPSDEHGTVLRWHEGPEERPRVIYWSAPAPGTEGVCR